MTNLTNLTCLHVVIVIFITTVKHLDLFYCNSYYVKEGNVFLFNDTLNTFYLRLYGVGHMVKDHSDSDR